MKNLSKPFVAVLALLLTGNVLFSGAKAGVAQAMSTSIAATQSETGQPACWVAVGNKVYFVEKDTTTILKVKASGAF